MSTVHYQLFVCFVFFFLKQLIVNFGALKMYSSDEDSDGFEVNLSEEFEEVRFKFPGAERNREKFFSSFHQALVNGNIVKLRECFEDQEYVICINAKLFDYWTPLLYASQSGNVDCVRFLIQNGAQVDVCCNDVTCLMTACDSDAAPERVLEVVEVLLEEGVSVKHSDYRGRTALMFACAKGLLNIVERLIGESNLEAKDFTNWTALFHAIEKNRIEVVKYLLGKNALTELKDSRGYTPKQVAEMKGLQDIVDILPSASPQYLLPSRFLSYKQFQDLLPGLQPDIPAYFPDIQAILYGSGCEDFLQIFGQEKVSLLEFLSMTNDRLRSIGIRLPMHRKKILHGIFRFHSRKWSKSSLNKFDPKKDIDTYDLFLIASTQLKHSVILLSSCNHILNTISEANWRPPLSETVETMRKMLESYRNEIDSFRERVTYIQSFNPKPMINIDYEETRKIRIKKRQKELIFYTLTALGFIFVCNILKKSF